MATFEIHGCINEYIIVLWGANLYVHFQGENTKSTWTHAWWKISVYSLLHKQNDSLLWAISITHCPVVSFVRLIRWPQLLTHTHTL